MKIDFDFIHPIFGVYRDALTLPDDHGFTDNEIQAMKQQRFDNWVAFLENPPPPAVEEPVIEEPVVGE